MKKEKQELVHHYFYTDEEYQDKFMTILTMENGNIIDHFVVPMPAWFEFNDDRYKFYPFCHN